MMPPRYQMTMAAVRFLRDAQAATAVEYSLIAAGIALAIVASVAALGTQVDAMFESVAAGFN